MPKLKVHSRALTTASLEEAWAVVREFCAPWHPWIETMRAERTENGGLVRRFTVKGENTVYRERLTYFSDHDRAMGYTHVSGIEGVQSYDARLTVSPTATGAVITMSAVLSAPASRAQAIADGTQAVFDAGTKAVADLAQAGTANRAATPALPAVDVQSIHLDNLPRLTVSVAGEESDVLCLFLHGIGGNRSNWTAQFSVVAHFCKVASLDLRGYGDSALGAGQSTIDDYCADILHVMNALGAKKLVLCGLSYGAWIATSFAMRHSDKLIGLVVCGGCTGMSEAGADEREAFRLSREVPLNEGQTPADFAPAVVSLIAGPNVTSEVRGALMAAMQAIPSATYADALRCFTNPLEKFDFSKLNLPVLLITGEHDRLAPPTEIKGVAERIWDASPCPDVRFEMLTDAGHVCNLEKPDEFNAILVEYLARVMP